MEKKEYTLGEQELYVEQHIPNERKFENTLVFVHASFGGYWMWNTIIPILVAQGFECVTFSLRGHKPSGGDIDGVHMTDYENDIATIVGELKLESPVLIGHSMSGLVVLMAAKNHSVKAVVSIDPSPSLEVQGVGNEEDILKIKPVYNAMDAGMPMDPADAMKAMPDVPKEMLMKMKDMLGDESGVARQDRKRGISIPKESMESPILFIGAELGDSVPFGISFEKTEKMAEYYASELLKIDGASHPGIVMGKHAPEVAERIASWLENK